MNHTSWNIIWSSDSGAWFAFGVHEWLIELNGGYNPIPSTLGNPPVLLTSAKNGITDLSTRGWPLQAYRVELPKDQEIASNGYRPL